VVTPAAKREAVADLQATHGMSERRLCRVIDADRESGFQSSTRTNIKLIRGRIYGPTSLLKPIGAFDWIL